MNDRPFPEKAPSLASREERLGTFILSISGWRHVFAPEGHEEGLGTQPGETDLLFTAIAASRIARFFQDRAHSTTKGKSVPTLVLARDSRPTGAALEAVVLRSLLAHGVHVETLGIVSLPQALAHVTGSRGGVQGFVYLTASHNPPGWNGFKIGAENGEVLAEKEAKLLIEDLKKAWLDDAVFETTVAKYNDAGDLPGKAVWAQCDERRAVSRKRYFELIHRISSGSDDAAFQGGFLKRLADGLAERSWTLACDFNGSSRLQSIDRQILEDLGVRLLGIGEVTGAFSHRIVPEGESLVPLQRLMESSETPITLGWAPDCDGDRGNLVLTVRDETGRRQVTAPDAQTTFALAVITELAWLKIVSPRASVAVVANDATSHRIDEIASRFGAVALRGETGEANVLARARQAANQGRVVRILGEGSNGGNITKPGTVRDPLATVFALLKLLALLPARGEKSPAQVACHHLGLPDPGDRPDPEVLLGRLLDWNLRWNTTSAFDEQALIRLKSRNQAALKRRYEEGFMALWLRHKDEWAETLGIREFRFLNYEGAIESEGPGNRKGAEDGGFVVRFLGEAARPLGGLWMRGSRTEPVFRLTADVLGPVGVHDRLLAMHRDLIARADEAAN